MTWFKYLFLAVLTQWFEIFHWSDKFQHDYFQIGPIEVLTECVDDVCFLWIKKANWWILPVYNGHSCLQVFFVRRVQFPASTSLHTCHISHSEIKSHRIWPIWKPIPKLLRLTSHWQLGHHVDLGLYPSFKTRGAEDLTSDSWSAGSARSLLPYGRA